MADLMEQKQEDGSLTKNDGSETEHPDLADDEEDWKK
jgi:hypothetical protein